MIAFDKPKSNRIAIPRKLEELLKSKANEIRKADADKMAILVHELMKHSFRNDLYDGWVNIHSDKLIELMGNGYLRQLERLIEWQVIRRTKAYLAGNRSFSGVDPFSKAISLSWQYGDHENCVFWTLTTKKCLQTIEREFKITTRTNTAAALAEFFPEFQLQISSEDYRNPQFQNAWNLENIERISTNRFFAVEDSFSGRFHSSYTQLQTETRDHLILTSSRQFLTDLDVSCCQPLILGVLLRNTEQRGIQKTAQPNPHTLLMSAPFLAASTCNKSTRKSTANDVDQWIKDSEAGQLYVKLRSNIPPRKRRFIYTIHGTRNRRIPVDIGKMNPKQFKRGMLQTIFDRNESNQGNPIWEAIVETYPTVAEFVACLKATDHRFASQALQTAEVQLMIQSVAAQHIKHGLPIITIHDAILTPRPDESRRIMRKVFADHGINPSIR